MLPPTSSIDDSQSTSTSAANVPALDEVTPVLDTNDPTVRALIQAAVAHQQQQEAVAAAAAAAAAAALGQTENTTTSTGASTSVVSLSAAALADAVPAEILRNLIPPGVTTSPLPAPSIASISTPPVSVPAPVSAPAATSATATTITSTPAPTTTSTAALSSSKTSSSSSNSSSSSTSSNRPFTSSTKRFNPDDIFCLGCCRNLSVEHYTCAATNRIFKSCNACRHKSRVNSKKVTKPTTVPTKPTISMDEFGAKLKELEEDNEDESSLDVMVRLEGSVEMDPETLKSRGARIAAQVYESTGYWFSHSRTNDETQSKTRLKIYGCSQREDRRAPPAPKTQSRKRNRQSTKAYFPCKGNLTMTFYHSMNHVRVVYSHKKHAKYDNRKCPDHVRAFVKNNLNLPPRQIYDALIESDPGLGITQAQVRYWSHFYKRGTDQNQDHAGKEDSNRSSSDVDQSMISAVVDGSSQKDLKDDIQTGNGGSTSPQEQHQQTEQDRVHQEQVEQLIASNAAFQSLARSHQQSLVGGPIAISVPMSDMDTTPLTSSIVQSVLAEDGGKGLLQLQASLNAVASVPAVGNGGDAVVQEVTAFMKENDRHILEQLAKREQS